MNPPARPQRPHDHDGDRRRLGAMSVISLAVIGKSGEPLYLKEFHDEGSSLSDLVSEEELFGLSSKQPVEDPPSTSGSSCSLRQQFLLHAALDRFEQLAGPPPGCAWRAPGVTGADAMWVGLLCPVEDMRIYGKCWHPSSTIESIKISRVHSICSHPGYMTTTQIKFILTVYDDVAMGDQKAVDETIKQLFIKIHLVYVAYLQNPFSHISAPITSARFDSQVRDCIAAFNKSTLL